MPEGSEKGGGKENGEGTKRGAKQRVEGDESTDVKERKKFSALGKAREGKVVVQSATERHRGHRQEKEAKWRQKMAPAVEQEAVGKRLCTGGMPEASPKEGPQNDTIEGKLAGKGQQETDAMGSDAVLQEGVLVLATRLRGDVLLEGIEVSVQRGALIDCRRG